MVDPPSFLRLLDSLLEGEEGKAAVPDADEQGAPRKSQFHASYGSPSGQSSNRVKNETAGSYQAMHLLVNNEEPKGG